MTSITSLLRKMPFRVSVSLLILLNILNFTIMPKPIWASLLITSLIFFIVVVMVRNSTLDAREARIGAENAQQALRASQERVEKLRKDEY